MPLSDTAIRQAKPKDKPYKLADEKGLYAFIQPTGSKLWRFDYRLDDKRKTLALGVYPDVPLKEARQKRDGARKLVAEGIDPGDVKRATKTARKGASADSFEVIAREWHAGQVKTWSEGHGKQTLSLLELNVFPWLGKRPIAEIKAPELLAVLRRIESRGMGETTRRTKGVCGQVFRYAVATGRAERDPSGDLKGALHPVKEKHYAAITDPAKLGDLLRAIHGYSGTFPVSCALKLAPMLFVRPGELRAMEWAHVDLDAAEWRFTASKTGTAHIVPLSDQAVDILKELHPLTGHGRFVFPSARNPRGDRCMSENAVLAAIRRLGYGKDEMTGHGFRAVARTILDEVLGFPPHVIEQQLAHSVRDPLGRAYNRTAHLEQRKRMMQAWSDYLDGLRQGATVLLFKKVQNVDIR